MALIELLRWLPDDQAMRQWWTLHHATDHQEIVQAIGSQKSIALTIRQLEPYNEKDKDRWNLRHQQMHDDMNGALGLAGNNLQNIDMDNPEEKKQLEILHFKEHQNARLALGI